MTSAGQDTGAATDAAELAADTAELPADAAELPTEAPLSAARQALSTLLDNPAAMAALKRAAMSFAGRRAAADDLLADVLAAIWAGDLLWDPKDERPGAMQGHLIRAMEHRAKEVQRDERRLRRLEALPADKEADTRLDGPDEQEMALAAWLDRMERIKPRLRERLREDPEAQGTLWLFEHGLGRAHAQCPGGKMSLRELRRQYHNARRRLLTAARAIIAELAHEDELANGDTSLPEPARTDEPARADEPTTSSPARKVRKRREPAPFSWRPSIPLPS